MKFFYLLPWSTKHLLWINAGKTLKPCVSMKGHQVINSLASICLILFCGLLVQLIYLHIVRSFTLMQGRWLWMLIFVCSHWEDQTTQFWGGYQDGISLSLIILLHKFEFEVWVLSTTNLAWVLPTASLTVSSVPALGIINPLILASSFVPKGSHIFSKEREWNAEE